MKMKTKIIKSLYLLMLVGFLAGCTNVESYNVEKGIYVNKNSLTLFVGEQAQLTASPVGSVFDWESRDTDVATVSKTGLVETVGAGTTDIVASLNGASARVTVTAITRIPLQDVLLSAEYIELMPDNKVKISTTLVPQDANDIEEEFTWKSENPTIATIDPFGEITALVDGVTKIIYQGNGITKYVTVEVSSTKAFNGPHIVSAAAPCIIPAWDYDLGGEGKAFHEVVSGQSNASRYRTTGGDPGPYTVGIYMPSGTVPATLGYTGAGEWLLYTVEVQDAGDYWVDAEVYTQPGNINLEVDGIVLSSLPIPVPATRSWVPNPGLPVSLTVGKHKIKLIIVDGSINIQGIRVTHQ
jgi:hypothetical protein